MTLTVCDTLFTVSPVRQCVDNVPKVPLVIGFVLEQLDPHVRNSHGKSVVEANTALIHGTTKKWHARNILGNRNDRGVQTSQHIVSLQLQVSERKERFRTLL